MIVREIRDSPEEVIENFDWFNDYEDTRRWCIQNCTKVIKDLDNAFKIWLKNRNTDNNIKKEKTKHGQTF